MDGVTIQQSFEWHFGRWNGFGQDYPDYQSYHILDREKTTKRTIFNRGAIIVSVHMMLYAVNRKLMNHFI